MKELEAINLDKLSSPKGKFILGHYSNFKASDKHIFLEKGVEECGPIYSIHLVNKKFVVSAIPSLNNEILKARPKLFKRLPKINAVLQEMGISGVFNAEGESWKKHRKLTAESLSLRKVRGYFPIVLEKSESLLSKFKHFSNTQQPIDIQREFMLFTIDVTTAIAFGYNLNAIHGKDAIFQQHLERIFMMLNERNFSPIPIWKWYKRSKDRELENSLKHIETTIYKFIGHAKENLKKDPKLQESPTNFLEALLVENIDGSFSDKEVYGNIFTMLLGGEDSTSSSLSWVLYYLAQNPDMIKKVRDEALSIYGDHSAPNTFEQYQQLEYTNAVVQETLRIHPTTTQQIVQANEDCRIQGLQIKKNTKLILLNRYAQRLDEHFSDAMTFKPERWLKSKCPVHQNHDIHTIKAFGGGPRLCPGMNLALSEMVPLISMVCKQFDIELAVNKDDVSEKHSFIVYPENLFIKLHPVK
ncbi:Cytochrome P450 [Tenacibaculum sp. MAR_2009_124]|uniref:cytochrome P450 n=1 Tax=Tenacibaculum sp. MAR_2009_124 TaxID=1250059 RepID=UPI00089A1B20|nr:cytochrome P450 [Tenacibaculum sp. MAR_2009_124]SEB51201.1 Cytochrome P450 [Tenacibaculum sp. MAR_2009_124]